MPIFAHLNNTYHRFIDEERRIYVPEKDPEFQVRVQRDPAIDNERAQRLDPLLRRHLRGDSRGHTGTFPHGMGSRGYRDRGGAGSRGGKLLYRGTGGLGIAGVQRGYQAHEGLGRRSRVIDGYRGGDRRADYLYT